MGRGAIVRITFNAPCGCEVDPATDWVVTPCPEGKRLKNRVTHLRRENKVFGNGFCKATQNVKAHFNTAKAWVKEHALAPAQGRGK